MASRTGTVLIWLVVFGALFVAGLFVYSVVHHILFIDPCLDAGGCWDSVDNVCRKTEVNAQELCDRVR